MENVSEIKNLYNQLKAIISQAPPIKDTYETASNTRVAEGVNKILKELTHLTQDTKYSEMEVTIDPGRPFASVRGEAFNYSESSYNLHEFRTNLMSAIMRLHNMYFSEDPEPFSGPSPNSINIQQHQSNVQIIHQDLIIQVTEGITRLINDPSSTSEEKSFLSELKSGLSYTREAIELIKLIVQLAGKYRIAWDFILKLLQ